MAQDELHMHVQGFCMFGMPEVDDFWPARCF